jgi:hypothetical protein
MQRGITEDADVEQFVDFSAYRWFLRIGETPSARCSLSSYELPLQKSVMYAQEIAQNQFSFT